jgi:bifunctional DNA-binding transcriptional regulator/antitoxin component of YhaV-PrlF toxin-antitoxin module
MTSKVKAKVSTAKRPVVTKSVPKKGAQISIKNSTSKVEVKLSTTVKKIKAKERAQRAGRTMSTRVSAKNQITIPVDILRKAGFKVGDAIYCSVDDDGKVLLSKPVNPMLQYAGIFTGMYEGFDLRADRDAWDE